MGTSQTYHSLFRQIRQLHPEERVTRVRTLSWLMVGMLWARSVHLSRIANHLFGQAQKTSKEQRLRRWLKNRAVRVRRWYAPVARALLAAAAQQGTIRLLADGTQVGTNHRLLMIAVAYRRRALPIAWSWVADYSGLSSSRQQCALLAYIHQLLPSSTRVVFIGDSEFCGTGVKRLLERWQWGYIVRQKGDHLVYLSDQGAWRRFDSLIDRAGQRLWVMNGRLTKTQAHPCQLLAYWRRGESLPWLLATNLTNPTDVYRLYSRRMWIEELFGDLKKHGFDIEQTHLHHFLRLSRLTLAAVLLYVFLVAFGAYVIKRGWRKFVDRTDRRDLSIFRIGYDMLVRCLSLGQSPPLRLVPYF
jgi:hypothetical protein